MAEFFYNAVLFFIHTGIRLASLWNTKARQWVEGRKKTWEDLEATISRHPGNIIWMHCASLGEFEQGRPVLEKIKSLYPGTHFILTFFSPSGYEIRKDFREAAGVFYLPIDSPAHAKRFLDITRPSLVIFVKYDYWYHYLHACKKRNIPLLMVSAIFRKKQPFFRWYGSLHRKMLRFFTRFFVQNMESVSLLEKTGINNVTPAGDTRFDRVLAIAEAFQPLDEITKYCGEHPVMVAGSTWPEDERLIREAFSSLTDLKLIIAPHEIHDQRLEELKKVFPGCLFYSELKTRPNTYGTDNVPGASCLIIDNIGLLSRLYKYATITYVGGGFNSGIHNTLEAAVYGKPVIFGPKHKKFREAMDLIQAGGAFSIAGYGELKDRVLKLLVSKDAYETACRASKNYVSNNRGATEKIIGFIQENRLLTS